MMDSMLDRVGAFLDRHTNLVVVPIFLASAVGIFTSEDDLATKQGDSSNGAIEAPEAPGIPLQTDPLKELEAPKKSGF